MKFEEALELVGSYGKYQRTILPITQIACAALATQAFLTVFTLPTVPTLLHRCAVPSLSNDSFEAQGEWHQQLINQSIPWDAKEDRYSSCTRYSGNGSSENTSSERCDRWVYDRSIFKSTVTEKFEIVCDRVSIGAHVQMLYMLGLTLSGFLMGQLSDLLGRKLSLTVGVVTWLLSGFFIIFSPNIWVYAVLRLLNGFGSSAIFIGIFVIGVELVSPSKRVVTANNTMIIYALGELLFVLVAYFVRDWKYLHLAVTIPWVTLLIICWFAPESPRWMLCKGKHKQAEQLFRKIAKMNGTEKKLPEVIFSASEGKTKKATKSATLIDVFKSRVLLFRALIVFFNWAVNTMVYYGLTLNSGNLGTNTYLSFALSAFAELLAYFFTWFVLNKWGRKWPLCGVMVFGGLACVSTLFVVIYGDPDNVPAHNAIILALSSIGKFCISVSFATIYVFTAELFPTEVRNATLGASSTFGRIGGILSPYVADIALYIRTDFGKALPLIIFGGLSITAGCLAMLLPETYNKKLADTIKEGEEYGRKPSVRAEEDGDEMKAHVPLMELESETKT